MSVATKNIVKMDIMKFRLSNMENNRVDLTNTDSIKHILEKYGLVQKPAGLCAAPHNKYFSFSREIGGVSHSFATPVNDVHIIVNYNNSSYSKKRYWRSICIIEHSDGYYVELHAQSAIRYKDTPNPETCVYIIGHDQLEEIIGLIFQDVE